jgi:RsiW-degrading membrane proteinase PrsW (M82 family)
MSNLRVGADDRVSRRTARRTALKLFLVGLVLWVATVVVTVWTLNSNLIPTVILIGSFLVPATFVTWAFERGSALVTPRLILFAFVVGGVSGVLLASILESQLINTSSLWQYAWVGFIEEFAKLLCVVFVAWHMPAYTMRDGAVLGATVGFGFAAFESAGYAFNAMLTVGGLDLRALVETEVLRGILTPLGHGVWTAILGAILFSGASRTGRLRITGSLVIWYVIVSVLHTLWDASGGLAALITWELTKQEWQTQLVKERRLPTPTTEQVHLFAVLSWGLLLLDALIGLILFLGLWRRAQSELLPMAQQPGQPAAA